MIRVLYLSHTARVSGAERSLLELIAALRAQVEPVLACPEGELSRRAETAGLRTVRLDPLDVGFGSGSRELLRAGGRLVRTAARVATLSRRLEIDVVHAASARAGIIAACASLMGGGRPVVDVRDALPSGPRAAVVRLVLRASARAIVFNSEYTQGRFGKARRLRDVVVYPPVDISRLLLLPPRQRSAAQPVLGVIGQLTPWKGQDDAIRILALLRTRFPGTRLRIIGSVVFTGQNVTFDNEAYVEKLTRLAAELGLSEAVDFAGATDDLASALSSLDVLLVPSWQEPFGRVVVEGMAAGVPVVATRVGGPAELLEDGVTGLLVPPHAPEAWLEPVARLLEDPDSASRIALAARGQVESVLDRRPMSRMIQVYGARANVARGHEIAVEQPGLQR